jgi:hypothetical protein
MDSKMRDAIRSVEPPAHLRESILAAAKVAPIEPPKFSRFSTVWLAIAAGIVLAAGALFFFAPRGGKLDLAALDARIPKLTSVHEHSFASAKGNMDAARAWLHQHGGAYDFVFPKGLTALGGMECEVLAIEKVNVTILCFQAGNGHTAHLYVVDRSQLANPPPTGTPEMRQLGDYATASWTQGDRSYVLAQRGDIAELSRIL